MIRWVVAIPLMFVVAIIQVSVFDLALVGGAIRLDLPLYLLVAIGLCSRSTQAALGGFVLGLVVDLFQFGPFGIHALIYCLAGWSFAEARLRVLQDGASARTMQGVFSTLVVTVLTWLAGPIFGQEPLALSRGPWGVLATLVIVGLLGGIAVHPMSRVVGPMVLDSESGRAGSAVGL